MIEPLRGRLLERHGFEADMEHFAIFGVCQKCAKKAARDGSKAGGGEEAVAK
jgi:Fur family ferric uptake transcriptional regulator